ncbi:thioredoxin [Halobacteriales archaeon QS_8_69_26]|nr:MAG: thioredoxin [Halobacteriales archaeon QS_8_69_26]
MADPDELERIRQEKIAEMIDEPGDGEGDAGGTASPDGDEPVHVEGPDHLSDLVGSGDVVLADFYADWCGPCQALEPVLADVAAESPATVAKVDVDEHQRLAAEYGVRGVPTLVLFADGDPVERLVGMQRKESLLRLIDRHAE